MTEIKFNVLIAEDEENIGNFISAILKTNGYKPIIATTGNQAIQCAESYCPDVILLDLGLPDMDGIDVISEIRKWAVTPIIVISARNRESEKVKALDAGADDYITKPFGNQELLARIRTALRHRRQPMGAETKTPMYHAGQLKIDFDKRRVFLGEEEIRLTQIEYKLVSLLAENLSCGGGYNGNLWDTKLDGMELTYQEIQQTEKIVTVESDTWAAVEKLFRVPGVKMIYRMEGVYTLKPEISYREAGKEHFGLYVDADTELLAEDIMAAVPSVTSVSEKNAITNYTGMGTGETYTKYSYDVAVDWDANIENKPAALLDLVKQFGKVDGVQYALPEVTYIEIYVSSPDDFILYPVEETTAAEDAVVGDLNQDGSLDVTDAVLLGKAAAGAVELSAAQKSSADVNHDGTVDSSDTVKLMQFLVRLVDTL